MNLNLLTIGFMAGCALTWFIFSRYRQWLLSEIQRAEKTEREVEARNLVLTTQLKYMSEKLHRANEHCRMLQAAVEAQSRLGRDYTGMPVIASQVMESELPKVTEE